MYRQQKHQCFLRPHSYTMQIAFPEASCDLSAYCSERSDEAEKPSEKDNIPRSYRLLPQAGGIFLFCLYCPSEYKRRSLKELS